MCIYMYFIHNTTCIYIGRAGTDVHGELSRAKGSSLSLDLPLVLFISPWFFLLFFSSSFLVEPSQLEREREESSLLYTFVELVRYGYASAGMPLFIIGGIRGLWSSSARKLGPPFSLPERNSTNRRRFSEESRCHSASLGTVAAAADPDAAAAAPREFCPPALAALWKLRESNPDTVKLPVGLHVHGPTNVANRFEISNAIFSRPLGPDKFFNFFFFSDRKSRQTRIEFWMDLMLFLWSCFSSRVGLFPFLFLASFGSFISILLIGFLIKL